METPSNDKPQIPAPEPDQAPESFAQMGVISAIAALQHS
jgi:hypothetical protein